MLFCFGSIVTDTQNYILAGDFDDCGVQFFGLFCIVGRVQSGLVGNTLFKKLLDIGGIGSIFAFDNSNFTGGSTSTHVSRTGIYLFRIYKISGSQDVCRGLGQSVGSDGFCSQLFGKVCREKRSHRWISFRSR